MLHQNDMFKMVYQMLLRAEDLEEAQEMVKVMISKEDAQAIEAIFAKKHPVQKQG